VKCQTFFQLHSTGYKLNNPAMNKARNRLIKLRTMAKNPSSWRGDSKDLIPKKIPKKEKGMVKK
jgi:hypothetical protein